MPGRTSVRANVRNRASDATIPRKSSTQTLKSRASSTRNSALAVQIPDEGEETALRKHIASAFSDAQRSVATQRKSVIALRNVQEFCCYEGNASRKHQLNQDFDETEFNEEMGRCVLRILGIKKSEPVGDRLVKFLGMFLTYASEKDNAIFQNSDAETTDGFVETPTSRLVSHVVSLALNVMNAKDKFVRYRATQLVAHVINTLESIDDQLYCLIRLALIKRLRDKESIVRVQAVLGLGPFADETDEQEDDDSDDESASGVLARLLEALQYDPSADVRRALLLNLTFTPTTLPYLMERARDTDPATRRALYAKLLPALGDFRHLSLVHREKLLRWGLRDRDENVRKATARLFRERWIEDCAQPRQDGEEVPTGPPRLSEPNVEALTELLERIDVNNSGLESGIAHEAMKEFWDGRPDYQSHVSFEDPFFDELTPESAFVARTFTEFARKSGDAKIQNMLEDKMPEVTKFAFILQIHLNRLVEAVNKVAFEAEDADAEEDAVRQEFCVEQLLNIALTLDYSDEMGRRKMFQIMREALALAELPEECTRLVIEILRAICGTEEEFASIVLEAIAEVHDTISDEEASNPDESFHSARSELNEAEAPAKGGSKKLIKQSAEEQAEEDEERAVREIQVNLKCLHIAQCMLQNVQGRLESSSHLKTMLNNLVVPAVRSQETPIREAGLKCMGLCCLLSKNLAEENLLLFLHCFNKGSDELQHVAIQIITDVLITHPGLLAPPAHPAHNEAEDTEPPVNQMLRPCLKMYSKGLRTENRTVQAKAGTALAKLMLAGTIREPDLLKQMVLAYFDPDTQSNPSLRQALTYFLPVYCHSKRRNAEAMARVAVPVLHFLAERAEDMDEEAGMVGLNLVAAQLGDWTDPRKAVGEVEMDGVDAHVVLAGELLEKVLTPGCSKDERKTYISLLGKLHIAPTKTLELQGLMELCNEAFESRVATETATRNTLNKLMNTLTRIMGSKETTSIAEEQASPDTEDAVEQQDAATERAETTADEADETEVQDSPDDDGDITGMPDAEGTRFFDDHEMTEATEQESLVDDLLDDTLS